MSGHVAVVTDVGAANLCDAERTPLVIEQVAKRRPIVTCHLCMTVVNYLLAPPSESRTPSESTGVDR